MNKLSKGTKIYVTSKKDGALIMIDEIAEVQQDIAISKQLVRFEKEFEKNIFCLDPGSRKIYDFHLETPQMKAKANKQALIIKILNKSLNNYSVEQLEEVLEILK